MPDDEHASVGVIGIRRRAVHVKSAPAAPCKARPDSTHLSL